MKRQSALRDRMLDAYRGASKVQADYYEAVFDRWVRVFGPPVTFPPRYGAHRFLHQSDYAGRLAVVLSGEMQDVSDRILSVITSNRTASAFKDRVGGGAFLTVYVKGGRYTLHRKQDVRRMQEMLFCYAVIGHAGIIQQMERGLGKI